MRQQSYAIRGYRIRCVYLGGINGRAETQEFFFEKKEDAVTMLFNWFSHTARYKRIEGPFVVLDRKNDAP